VPLEGVSWDFGDVHVVINLPDTPELIEISSYDDKLED